MIDEAHGTIVPRQLWSRGQVEARLANLLPCPAARKPESTLVILAQTRSVTMSGGCQLRSREAPENEVRDGQDSGAAGSIQSTPASVAAKRGGGP